MRLGYYDAQLVVTAGAYTANDVVGGRINFGNIPSGILRAVTLVDQASQAGAYQLVLFRRIVTDITDNGANDIADADLEVTLGAIHLTDTAGADSFTFSDNKIYCRQGLALPIVDVAPLYGFLIAKGSPTYAATTDVWVILSVEH